MIRSLLKLASWLLMFKGLSLGNPKRIAGYAVRRVAHSGGRPVDGIICPAGVRNLLGV